MSWSRPTLDCLLFFVLAWLLFAFIILDTAKGGRARRLYIVFAMPPLFICPVPAAYADQHYSQEVFFDNSLAPGSYPYSEATVSAPSRLKRVDGKLPVESTEYISGPNALELQWQSAPEGGWDAQLNLYQWRNRIVNWPGADAVSVAVEPSRQSRLRRCRKHRID